MSPKMYTIFLLLAQRGSRAYDILRTRLVGSVHNDICDLHVRRSRSLMVVTKQREKNMFKKTNIQMFVIGAV